MAKIIIRKIGALSSLYRPIHYKLNNGHKNQETLIKYPCPLNRFANIGLCSRYGCGYDLITLKHIQVQDPLYCQYWWVFLVWFRLWTWRCETLCECKLHVSQEHCTGGPAIAGNLAEWSSGTEIRCDVWNALLFWLTSSFQTGELNISKDDALHDICNDDCYFQSTNIIL